MQGDYRDHQFERYAADPGPNERINFLITVTVILILVIAGLAIWVFVLLR